jgi:pyruvate formate lyase activating enzyme
MTADCQTSENVMALPVIREFLASSFNEWDGRIAMAVVLGHCNMRCPFCHGWRFVKEPEAQPQVPIDTIERSIRENEGWLDGVVISGGEPTLDPNLEDLIDYFRERGLAVKLHTNGLRPEVVAPLLEKGKLDCLALDFKAPLEEEAMRRAADLPVRVERIRESFALAGRSETEVELHTTLCPATLALETLPEMAETVRQIVPRARWIWQRYNPGDVLNPDLAGSATCETKEVERILEEVRPIHAEIEVRGFPISE